VSIYELLIHVKAHPNLNHPAWNGVDVPVMPTKQDVDEIIDGMVWVFLALGQQTVYDELEIQDKLIEAMDLALTDPAAAMEKDW
jgi:hypothetical protein